jgi:hypothetical protein
MKILSIVAMAGLITLTSAFAQDGWEGYDGPGPGPDVDGPGGGGGGEPPEPPLCVYGALDGTEPSGGYELSEGRVRKLKLCAESIAPGSWNVEASVEPGMVVAGQNPFDIYLFSSQLVVCNVGTGVCETYPNDIIELAGPDKAVVFTSSIQSVRGAGTYYAIAGVDARPKAGGAWLNETFDFTDVLSLE